MDAATQAMIGTLDKRISKLQEIRRLLVEEFGEEALSPVVDTGKRQIAAPAAPTIHAKTGNEKPRKIQIHEWLKAHGPSTRGEILKGTQFPGGTVGSLLSQCPELFESRDGKWHAIVKML